MAGYELDKGKIEKVIGFILSMLFGLVYKEIIVAFNSMVDGINIDSSFSLSREICVFVIGVYCLDIFRMLHGYILFLYDDRNPTSLGPYPYSIKELAILVSIFIIPLICKFLLSNHQMNTQFPLMGILAFLGPLFIYLVLDLSLKNELDYIVHSNGSTPDEQNKKTAATNYMKFVKKWLIFDVCHYFVAIIVITAEYYGILRSNYYGIILTLSFIRLCIIFADYFFFNKDFYFLNS